jgi:hypothetical protein
MAVTAAGTPYVESSDNVADYPGVSLALANHIDDTGGKVLQVVSVFKADTFTTSSSTLIDVTGLTASITPVSNTNKILVMVSLALSNQIVSNSARGAILRGATVVGGGTAAGNRPSISFWHRASANAGDNQTPKTFSFIDLPATTSALTYKVQIATQSGGSARIGVAYGTDDDLAQGGRLASTITLMEISA